MTRYSFANRTLLGLVAVAFVGTPAMAGDWSYGGLKGMRGTSVPVPAPVPVPIYEPKWYLRGDVGFILRSAPGASESGARVGDAGPPDNTFGYGETIDATNLFFASSWSDDFDTSLTWSFGAGYYWSKNFRTDMTFGFHSDGKLTYSGEYRYTDGGGTYEGRVQDRTRLRTGTVLFNAYYDFSDFGRFRPYIGAGLGFAISELERRNSNEEVACATAQGTCSSTLFVGPTTTSADNHAISLAASVTAGVTYNLGEYTSLDLNYRYLYTGGTHVGMNIGGSNSDLDIDAQHQHQFRAGLRWDIN